MSIPFDDAVPGTEAILENLNPPQREAVRHEGGPLLVLAGAGSGKTRVLTRRVAWLIGSRGVFPGNILAVTFTNKAAGEMKERIVSLVGEPGRNAWIGTFHAIGARLLRREADRVGITRDFSIFDRADSLAAVKRVLAERGISPKEHSPDSFLSVISRAKNDLRTADDLAEEARGPWDRLVASVYRSYDEALRAQNSLDFDDLLVMPVRLLHHEETRQRYACLFGHVLVDEYQDTNRCQYEFLHAIAKDHRQLTVVGDDDQSIYRWRGADLSNILDFESDFPDAEVIRLEQNYRSTGTILAAANSVIRHNEGRKGKELWTENADGDPVLVLEVPDEQAEALAVLKLVKAALDEDGATPEDFVILYRTNAQSRVLENTFQLGRVPYQVVGGQRFYERREIKDVVAFLRLLANPADDVAVTRVINVPPRGIGKKTLEDLRADAAAAGTPLLEAMRRAADGDGATARPAVRKKLSSFFEVIDAAASRMESESVAEVTEALLEDLGYEKYLEKESEREAAARWENVSELLNAMEEFADTPEREDTGVAAFLQEVSLATDLDDYEPDAPKVTLMTLHTAKGLEYPWVFIAGCEEGLFPHANSMDEEEGLEEERRLFYVGVTRAHVRVVLLTAEARRRWGGMNLCVPSRFLDEIDPDLVERRALAPASRGPGTPRAARPKIGGGARRGAARTPARPAAEDVSDFLPSYEDESQVVGTVRPGVRVRHPSWGEGVIDAVEGTGESLKLTIRFRGGVLKKVLAIYAKLELLGE
jgi:DNA helicase-2/ATP-dependent DNA helicase PcrA